MSHTPHTCPTCGAHNKIVNQCRCDPNNLPTRPMTQSQQENAHHKIDGLRSDIADVESITAEQFFGKRYVSTHQIRSIGWLHGAAGTIILTPVFKSDCQVRKVSIPAADFDAIRHDEEKMKATAIRHLTALTPTP